MNLLHHPTDRYRTPRLGEVTVERIEDVDGLLIVLARINENASGEPMSEPHYAVCSYLPDGTRRGGSCTTVHNRNLAEETFYAYLASWRDPYLVPTAKQVIERWRARVTVAA